MTLVEGTYKISNSEVQTFKHCRRRWWLSWYRGLTSGRETVNSAASTGGRIHEALAAYYVPDGEVPGDPVAVLRAAQDRDAAILSLQTLSAFDEEAERFLLEQEVELFKAFDLERAMITGYLEWLAESGADADLEVVASEQYVETALEMPEATGVTVPVLLIGKLDTKIVKHDLNTQLFMDHKTVGTLYPPMLGLNQQMLHYHLIEWLNSDEGEARCAGALYNMLRKVKRTRASKPPYFRRQGIPHNRYELEAYQDKMIGTMEDIWFVHERLKHGANHQLTVYPTPSRDCTWICPFSKVCRMFDDGSRVEAALEAGYIRQDPYTYYERKAAVAD